MKQVVPGVTAATAQQSWQSPAVRRSSWLYVLNAWHIADTAWVLPLHLPGLPEEVLITSTALSRGYAVVAVSSRDREHRRCWSIPHQPQSHTVDTLAVSSRTVQQHPLMLPGWHSWLAAFQTSYSCNAWRCMQPAAKCQTVCKFRQEWGGLLATPCSSVLWDAHCLAGFAGVAICRNRGGACYLCAAAGCSCCKCASAARGLPRSAPVRPGCLIRWCLCTDPGCTPAPLR